MELMWKGTAHTGVQGPRWTQDTGGEWKIVDNPDFNNITAAGKAILERFEHVTHSGSLICVMGAINHYSINHTTGQGKLQGFALKTACVLSLPYTNKRSASAEETRKNTTKLLYCDSHPVSKRNMLFVLDDKIKSLYTAWVPGISKPAQRNENQFLAVRVGGIPAGVRKIYVSLEACRKIANSGLLCTMPGVKTIEKMNKVCRSLASMGQHATLEQLTICMVLA